VPYYVYIIESELDGSFYKGSSENYLERLENHNRGGSTYTSHKRPWKLVYVEVCQSKTEALRREKSLKKATKERLIALINSPKNIWKS
jgi:putative endonuclease